MAASPHPEQRMDVSCDDAEEHRLVDAAARGDAGAFTQLFHRYYSMIHAYAYRFTLSNFDAEDIAQETFVKAARSLHTFRGESTFKSWLYRIAINASRDWGRLKAKRTRLDDALKSGEIEEAPHMAKAWANAGVNDGADDRVAAALASLPEEQRRAVILVYYDGMNHAEAARLLGCAETTLSWRIFKAKRKLKAVLSRKEARP